MSNWSLCFEEPFVKDAPVLQIAFTSGSLERIIVRLIRGGSKADCSARRNAEGQSLPFSDSRRMLGLTTCRGELKPAFSAPL